MKGEIVFVIQRKLKEVVHRFRARGLSHGITCLKAALINGFIRLANRYGGSHKVSCPCCDWHGYDFLWLDCGAFVVPHVLCPNCGAQERHRFFHFFLQEEFKTLTEECCPSVLHFAPERHVYQYLKTADNARYIGADYAFHMVEHLGFSAVQLDMQNLPFPDGVFDLIICFHVLEHVPDDRKGLSEIRRVLSTKGHAIIMVPMMMGQEKTIEYGNPDPDMFDHVRGYSPYDFAERLQDFTCRVIYPSELLSKAQLRSHAIPNDSQIIYVCRG